MIPPIEQIPITHGKGYTYIDQQTYENLFVNKEDTLDLKVDDTVTLYRVARDRFDGHIVFLKLTVTILEINEHQMLFAYIFGDQLAYKTMVLDRYGEDWYYIRVN